MAYPSIVARAAGTQTSDATLWTPSHPSGVTLGDLLLFIAGIDGNPTISTIGSRTLSIAANAHTTVTTGWTSPSNAFATSGDDTYATAAPGKSATINGDFGFPDIDSSQIPDGATIVAVRVICEWGMTALVTGGTLGCQPRVSGANSGSEATKTTTVEEQTTATFGSVTLANLRSASTVIKARVRCSKGSTNTAMTGNLDFVRLEVDWVEPGWVTSLGQGNDGGNIALVAAKKIADGTESGSFGVTWSAAEQGCWRVLRISPWHGTLGTNFTGGLDANGGDVQGGSVFTGTDNTAEIAGLNPGNWDTPEETLWLSMVAADHGDTVITPGGGSFTTEGTDQNSGGANGAALSVVYLQSTDDFNGAPTMSLSGAEQWASRTIAVRGTAATAQPPRHGFVNFQDPGIY